MVAFVRGILGTLVVVGLLVGAACAPAAAPKPTESPSSAAKPATGGDSTAEWEKVVAEAKKEGKVVVVGTTGEAYRDAMLSFQKAYPDIQVEYSGMKSSDFAPRIVSEREAGKYLWDVHVGGAQTALKVYKPQKIIAPLKPVLTLPEVLDSSKWTGGLDGVWIDKELQYVFGFEAGFMPTVMVNRSIVPESELNSIDQLVDAKWKGKIVTGNIRAAAGVPTSMISLLNVIKGEDWVRKFLRQDITVMSDERAAVEAAIRGSHPVMLMVAPTTLSSFRDPQTEGLLKNLQPVDLHGPGGGTIDTGLGNLMLVNNAPHPNAAKVFINWLLSVEGQKSYVEKLFANSRRLDVEGRGQWLPRSDIKYTSAVAEEFLPKLDRAIEIIKEEIK